MEAKGYEEGQLPELAEKLLDSFPESRVFCFEGELGAGKTTLIKQLCKKVGVSDSMSSPSFAIVNEYRTASGDTVFHCDFYRLKEESEAYDLGCEEYFDSGSYCFVEWPEKILNLLPPKYVWVDISRTNSLGELSARLC